MSTGESDDQQDDEGGQQAHVHKTLGQGTDGRLQGQVGHGGLLAPGRR